MLALHLTVSLAKADVRSPQSLCERYEIASPGLLGSSSAPAIFETALLACLCMLRTRRRRGALPRLTISLLCQHSFACNSFAQSNPGQRTCFSPLGSSSRDVHGLQAVHQKLTSSATGKRPASQSCIPRPRSRESRTHSSAAPAATFKRASSISVVHPLATLTKTRHVATAPRPAAPSALRPPLPPAAGPARAPPRPPPARTGTAAHPSRPRRGATPG